jgi:L-ribulose-5-phosphate 3-epimerase
MKCRNWPIGVCSWSLRMDVAGVAKAMHDVGLEHVHLAVRPAVEDTTGEYLKAVRARRWTITSTMIDFPQENYSTLETIRRTGGVAPDECWPHNRDLFVRAADVTAKLGVKYLSMHAGFIDESDETSASRMHDRIDTLAEAAQERGVILLLETGQETAEDLRSFLGKLAHNSVGVNFDPANMILYDKGDPIEAVRILAPWIHHLHVKDALRTRQPGAWGSEVPWGDGQVGAAAFLRVLEEVGFDGAMAIEREAGDNRLGDIAQAVTRLTSLKPSSERPAS